eukprot:scaffold649731_cov46-Prasinocladus_malaysianus.AAC.1
MFGITSITSSQHDNVTSLRFRDYMKVGRPTDSDPMIYDILSGLGQTPRLSLSNNSAKHRIDEGLDDFSHAKK